MRKFLSVAAAALMASVASARTVMIGDSMFAGGSKVNQWLQEWAGHEIENKAIVGSSLHEGWTKSIPKEWVEDVAKTPVPTTVIMDGGGNDVISVRSDCEAFNGNCVRQIDEAVSIGKELLDTLHDAGVAHVLWMGFFYLPGLNSAVDYGTEQLMKICADAAIDCHFADCREIDMPRGWDGVHPTDEGKWYKMLAEHIWNVKLNASIPL